MMARLCNDCWVDLIIRVHDGVKHVLIQVHLMFYVGGVTLGVVVGVAFGVAGVV